MRLGPFRRSQPALMVMDASCEEAAAVAHPSAMTARAPGREAEFEDCVVTPDAVLTVVRRTPAP